MKFRKASDIQSLLHENLLRAILQALIKAVKCPSCLLRRVDLLHDSDIALPFSCPWGGGWLAYPSMQPTKKGIVHNY